VTDDWLLEAMERVADTGRQARDAIAATVEAFEQGRGARLQGSPVAEVVEMVITAGGREVRLQATDAFRNWERAVLTMRASVVRSLVDDDGRSLTEVAERLRVSRQAAARLYQHAKEHTGEQG
jgi:hypothetical protein